MRRLLLVGIWLACIALGGNGYAAEARSASSLWDTFVHALETGDMKSAYDCFSPLSRQTYSYQQFCTDHHPLTVAYEAILITPTTSQFQVSGDVAELRFVAPIQQAPVAQQSDGPGGILVSALMVREDPGWFLVAPQRHAAARLEAETRNVLRRLAREVPQVRTALTSGESLDTQAVIARTGALLQQGPGPICLQHYELRTIRQGTRTLLQAWPKRPGLRAFLVDTSGTINLPGARKAQPILAENRNDAPAQQTLTPAHIETPPERKQPQAVAAVSPKVPLPELPPQKMAVPMLDAPAASRDAVAVAQQNRVPQARAAVRTSTQQVNPAPQPKPTPPPPGLLQGDAFDGALAGAVREGESAGRPAEVRTYHEELMADEQWARPLATMESPDALHPASQPVLVEQEDAGAYAALAPPREHIEDTLPRNEVQTPSVAELEVPLLSLEELDIPGIVMPEDMD